MKKPRRKEGFNLRERMLPVIEEITGTEYSAAGFVITAVLLLGMIGFAGYITGKSVAERFGGNKKKTVIVFTLTAFVIMSALICFFGASARAVRGGVMCIIMLYAAFEDIKKRECDDFLSVMLGIAGIMGKEPKELILSFVAFAGIILILLLSAAITKNGIGGGDVKFAGAASLVLGFFNTAAALAAGLLAAVIINRIKKQKSFPLLPYLAPAFMTAYFLT